MPGIDKSRLINDDEELLCGICSSVFINPIVLRCCQHTFCYQCIADCMKSTKRCPNDGQLLTKPKLLEPSREFVKMLNKIKLKCVYFENGCVKAIKYDRYVQHVEDCDHNPDAIYGNCDQTIGNQAEHDCTENLLSKYVCLRNLCVRNKILETSNKHLIDLNAQLNSELSSVKLRYEEKLEKMSEECEGLQKQLDYYKNACNDASDNSSDIKRKTYNSMKRCHSGYAKQSGDPFKKEYKFGNFNK